LLNFHDFLFGTARAPGAFRKMKRRATAKAAVLASGETNEYRGMYVLVLHD
jgi:hypothetical protein